MRVIHPKTSRPRPHSFAKPFFQTRRKRRHPNRIHSSFVQPHSNEDKSTHEDLFPFSAISLCARVAGERRSPRPKGRGNRATSSPGTNASCRQVPARCGGRTARQRSAGRHGGCDAGQGQARPTRSSRCAYDDSVGLRHGEMRIHPSSARSKIQRYFFYTIGASLP